MNGLEEIAKEIPLLNFVLSKAVKDGDLRVGESVLHVYNTSDMFRIMLKRGICLQMILTITDGAYRVLGKHPAEVGGNRMYADIYEYLSDRYCDECGYDVSDIMCCEDGHYVCHTCASEKCKKCEKLIKMTDPVSLK